MKPIFREKFFSCLRIKSVLVPDKITLDISIILNKLDIWSFLTVAVKDGIDQTIFEEQI